MAILSSLAISHENFSLTCPHKNRAKIENFCFLNRQMEENEDNCALRINSVVILTDVVSRFQEHLSKAIFLRLKLASTLQNANTQQPRKKMTNFNTIRERKVSFL